MKKVFSVLIFFFFISISFAQVPTQKGWWEFDDVNNLTKATIGNDLELVGSHTAIAGPDVSNGAVTIGPGSHYKMTHGITPGEGQTKVNQFSLQLDVRVADISFWHSLFQTSVDNSTDGDCFFNASGNLGVKATGYTPYSISANEWYRIVISVVNGQFYKYYIDGRLALEGAIQPVDDRFSLDNILLIFADEDGEDNNIDCAELAIWDVALSASNVFELGGFGHNIISDPMTPDGLWKFDNASNLSESVYGKDLTLVGTASSVDGPSALNKAIKIDLGSYFVCQHGISPNLGGTKVNDYSMKFDFRITELGKWRTFIQLTPANSDDGDCFINPDGAIGTQATGYGGYKLIPNEWYRLVMSVKNGSHYRLYLDGQLLLEGNVQTIDGRFSLEDTFLLFGDNDGDDGDIEVAEVAIWGRSLSETESTNLGGFGHNLSGGEVTKELVGNWKFDNVFDPLAASVGKPLELVGVHSSLDGPTAENFAARIGSGNYYVMHHGIKPNGGGSNVNKYSIGFDFRVQSLANWHSFFQTGTGNDNDADCFIATNGRIGLSATGYSPFAISENEWYRMIVSVENGTSYKIYLEGVLILDGSIQSVDGRFGLDSTLLVFADNDGEDDEIDCAELFMWNYALSDSEAAVLGGYGHVVGVENEDRNQLPKSFELSQNYPNPFNPETKINYALPKSGLVSIKVYDILGKEIATLQDGMQESGYYSVKFDGSNIASGIYFYRIVSGNFTATKKLILLK